MVVLAIRLAVGDAIPQTGNYVVNTLRLRVRLRGRYYPALLRRTPSPPPFPNALGRDRVGCSIVSTTISTTIHGPSFNSGFNSHPTTPPRPHARNSPPSTTPFPHPPSPPPCLPTPPPPHESQPHTPNPTPHPSTPHTRDSPPLHPNSPPYSPTPTPTPYPLQPTTPPAPATHPALHSQNHAHRHANDTTRFTLPPTVHDPLLGHAAGVESSSLRASARFLVLVLVSISISVPVRSSDLCLVPWELTWCVGG